eukprot:scaffold17594_cov35-Tisochrysis_lutea.AAC.3
MVTQTRHSICLPRTRTLNLAHGSARGTCAGPRKPEKKKKEWGEGKELLQGGGEMGDEGDVGRGREKRGRET